MNLKFEKWHGCSNDFIVFKVPDNIGAMTLDAIGRAVPNFCRRDGVGIGADGVIVVHRPPAVDQLPSHLTIYNSDGSLAANCGNGLRCAAASIRRDAQAYSSRDLEGLQLELAGACFDILFPNPKDIAVVMPPVVLGAENSWHEAAVSVVESVADLKSFGVEAVETADVKNRHLLVVVRDFDLERAAQVCQQIQAAYADPDGINVHLVYASDESPNSRQNYQIEEALHLFPYERGVGPTQACGSGAAAATAHTLVSGLVDRESWVEVRMPGGALLCQQRDEGGAITMVGPAELVFTGEVGF